MSRPSNPTPSSIIDLSPAWVSSYIPFMFGLSNSTTVNFDNSSNINMPIPHFSGLLDMAESNTVGMLQIMSGTPPSSPTIASLSSVASQVLCTFSSGYNTSGDFMPTVINTNPAVIATNYVNATASGTATWFLLSVVPATLNGWAFTPNASAALIHQIIGTVDVPSSDADLIMESTTLTAGQPCRVVNMQLLFPTTWSY